MPKAALPPDEPLRLQALQDYEILDTPVEPEFEAVTSLASSICDTPISVVNFIADGRQWFKSEVGIGTREMALEPSICAHALLQQELFVVQDTTKDERFIDNPLVVGQPGLRFYAGALLKSRDGFPLGTLCVLDTQPRTLKPEQIQALETLAKHVMNMLELRRRTKEQEVLVRELEQALAGRQRLMATVAHDLRTPLNIISMGAKLIEHDKTDSDTRRVVAGRVKRASKSMLGLVKDMVDIESQEGGDLKLDIQPAQLGAILADNVEMMSPLAEEAGVELRLRARREVTVFVDVARVDQVLSNLIGNALKFTPEGGAVTLSVELDGTFVAVSVTDTGDGIPVEEQDAIFDPYVRLRSMNTHGAGLGLAIAKRIVQSHGGEIGVSSVPGEGCTFRFTLPTTEQPDRPSGGGNEQP